MTIKESHQPKPNYSNIEIQYRIEMQMKVKEDRDKEAIERTIKILKCKGFNNEARVIESNLNKLL